MLIHPWIIAIVLFSTVAAPGMAADGDGAQPAAGAAAAHHRGLTGQSTPHNGWARYGHLTLDLGGDRYYIYDQSGTEFSATVIDRQSGTIKIRAVSIPGAGLFYYPAEAAPCEPDAIERMGLYAELLLYYLGSAAPAGPGSLDAPVSVVVDQPIPELHFMQGLMKPRDGARTVVTLTPSMPGKIQYVLRDDKDTIRGQWEAGRNRPAIPDDEPVLDWHSCWAGMWSTRTDGRPAFQTRLENASSLKTFGEVREALRASRASGKK